MRIGVAPDLLRSAPLLSDRLATWATVCDPQKQSDLDAVILRSVTRVDEAYLRRRPTLRYVASATSGTDHLHAAALAAAGVRWTAAPGCNAEAVADWVQVALERLWRAPPGVLGIVGAGHTGAAVRSRARELGWRVLENDPPRALRDASFTSRALAQLLRDSDVITLHVPLETSTRQLIGPGELEVFAGRVVLNASRGGVVDECAARRWAAAGGRLGLDVFEGEPRPHAATLEAAALVTPHIAGHTAAAKAEGVRRCLVWLARQSGHTLETDDVGLLHVTLDARRAIAMADTALRRGQGFEAVRAACLRRPLRG